MSKNKSTKILLQCALFLAMGLVLRNFSYMVYMGGGTGMRMGVSGFFTKMPAILFGPMYGAAVTALTDVLGYIIRPEGAYIFPMTITAACGGALSGLIFKAVKNKNIETINTVYLCTILVIGLFGAVNHVSTIYFKNTFWGSFLLSLDKKLVYFTYGMYIACVIGAVFYGINFFLQKKFKKNFMNEYLKIFITLLIADVMVTTVNTFILIAYIPTLAKLPFMSIYLPRLVQEIVSAFINSYVIAYMYELYQKISKRF